MEAGEGPDSLSREINTEIGSVVSQIVEAELETLQKQLNGIAEKALQDQISLEGSTLSLAVGRLKQPDTADGLVVAGPSAGESDTKKVAREAASAIKKITDYIPDDVATTKKGVVAIVKFFGGKFRPWGATRWAKRLQALKGINKILGPVLAAISAYELYRSLTGESRRKKELDALRSRIRGQLAAVADETNSQVAEEVRDAAIKPLFGRMAIEARQAADRATDLVEKTANFIERQSPSVRTQLGL